jgi:hypothetical protein
MRHQCQTETATVAGPPNNTRRQNVNTISAYDDEEEYFEDYSEDEIPLTRTAYPAVIRNELDPKDRRRPYDPTNRKTAMRAPQEFKTKTEPMVQDTPDVPQSESRKERSINTRKPREKKELTTFDPWAALAKEKVDISWAQLFEASPMTCASIKDGISNAKNGVISKALNISPKKTRTTTSCYAYGHIGRVPFEIIVDTGAGPSLISQEALNQLGWTIQGPTETTLVIADGSEATPLGVMYDVPVTFGDVTIIIDMQVTNSTSYEIIIGTDWLEKAQAVINMNNQRMQISNKGVNAIVSLNITAGARPRTINEFDTLTGATTNTKVDQETTYLADQPPSDSNDSDSELSDDQEEFQEVYTISKKPTKADYAYAAAEWRKFRPTVKTEWMDEPYPLNRGTADWGQDAPPEWEMTPGFDPNAEFRAATIELSTYTGIMSARAK